MRRMLKQYTGVTGTKHIIKWLYPEAVATFDTCSYDHDECYNQRDPAAWNYIDWSKGDDATLCADNRWLSCALAAANGNSGLIEDANKFYKVERIWGKMRAKLWRLGFRYY